MVPVTATIATADQYGTARYSGVRSCHAIATSRPTAPTKAARTRLVKAR